MLYFGGCQAYWGLAKLLPILWPGRLLDQLCGRMQPNGGGPSWAGAERTGCWGVKCGIGMWNDVNMCVYTPYDRHSPHFRIGQSPADDWPTGLSTRPYSTMLDGQELWLKQCGDWNMPLCWPILREQLRKTLTSLDRKPSGWWFGTFFIFLYIWNNHPNWLIFFRGVQTTNQIHADFYVQHPQSPRTIQKISEYMKQINTNHRYGLRWVVHMLHWDGLQ